MADTVRYRIMKIHRLAPLLCAALLATAIDASGLAGDLKEPGVAFAQDYPDVARQQVMAALNRPDCKFLKGHFINSFTSLCYAGETKTLNLLLADLAKCPGVTLHVSFTTEPIAGEGCDWVVSHDSDANRFAVRVSLKYDRIKLADLSLPAVQGPALPRKE